MKRAKRSSFAPNESERRSSFGVGAPKPGWGPAEFSSAGAGVKPPMTEAAVLALRPRVLNSFALGFGGGAPKVAPAARWGGPFAENWADFWRCGTESG